MQNDNKLSRIILTISFFINIIFFIAGIVFISRTDIVVLRRGMEEFGLLAPLAYMIVYTGLFIIPFNPVPKNVLTYFALASFGPFHALCYTLLADTIGVTINYLWAKRFEQLLPSVIKDKIDSFKGKKRWWVLMKNRITPITEGFAGADFPSYLAGLTKMPYAPFIVLTIIPWLLIDSVYFFGLNILLLEPASVGIVVALMIFSLSLTVIKFLEKR